MTDDEANRLANLLGQVSLRISSEVDEALADESGLRSAHAAGLVALLGYANGEQPETLAAALGFSQSGAVHMVDRLSERNWVERRRDPVDGRAVRIVLTPAGRRKARRLRAARQAVVERALASLDSGQQRAMVDALDRLAAEGVDSVAAAQRACRLCDPDACGHPDRCPVTRSLDAKLGRG